ncbi:hypothetical protein ACLESD_07815 [Pyxidicoccus sp. 3LFB2]
MTGSQIQKQGAQGVEVGTGGVAQVAAGELLQFLSTSYSIIRVGDGVTPKGFPAALLAFPLFQPGPFRLGVFDLGAIQWGAAARHLVRLALGALDMKPDGFGKPPAGYYLFASGEPIAYHAGEIDMDKDGGQVLLAFATFVVGAAFENKQIAGAASQVASWNVGERVVSAFQKAIDEHRKIQRR